MSLAPSPGLVPTGARLALADSDIHVWIATTIPEPDPSDVEGWSRWLPPRELDGVMRFENQERRTRALFSRVMRRAIPSRYFRIAPSEWRFHRSVWGKPEAIEPGGKMPLRLSLASTRGFVVCAVARRHDVGVDAECTDPLEEAPALSRELFSESEATDICSRHASGDPSRFYDYWTLREAYGKATGNGLEDALSPLTICLREGERPRLVSALSTRGESSGWHLELIHPAAGLTVAVALRIEASPQPTLTMHAFPTNWSSLREVAG